MLEVEVKINDIGVANCVAINTGVRHGGKNLYRCTVSGRDVRGYPYEHKFIVLFKDNAEATELVAAMLNASNKRLASRVQA